MIKVTLGTEDQVKLAYATAAHAFDLFKLPANLKVSIALGNLDAEEAHGVCYQITPRKYEIILHNGRRWTDKRVVRTVGHEMTHVKQYFYQKLDLEAGIKTARFDGKFYRVHYPIEYWLSPWEIEARGMEEYFVETSFDSLKKYLA